MPPNKNIPAFTYFFKCTFQLYFKGKSLYFRTKIGPWSCQDWFYSCPSSPHSWTKLLSGGEKMQHKIDKIHAKYNF